MAPHPGLQQGTANPSPIPLLLPSYILDTGSLRLSHHRSIVNQSTLGPKLELKHHGDDSSDSTGEGLQKIDDDGHHNNNSLSSLQIPANTNGVHHHHRHNHSGHHHRLPESPTNSSSSILINLSSQPRDLSGYHSVGGFLPSATLRAYQQLELSASYDGHAWILYTVIGACILISLITAIILYDLCQRYREYRDHTVFDGGPPASPGHQHSYTFGIRAYEASQMFNRKQSTITLDLLDSNNQFLTRLAIPSYILKFKVGQNHKSRQLMKSMSNFDTWNQFRRSDLVIFYLIRRNPLKNFTSIRLMHDCYDQEAHITFKYIIIRDDHSRQSARIELEQQPIRALHPCPPSGLQVFQAERVLGSQPLEETKSIIQLLTKSESFAFFYMFLAVTLSLSTLLVRIGLIGSFQQALVFGLLIGACSSLIMLLQFALYMAFRRGALEPCTLRHFSLYLLMLMLLSTGTCLFYSLYTIWFEMPAIRPAAIQAQRYPWILFLIISFLMAITEILIILVVACIIMSNIRLVQESEELAVGSGTAASALSSGVSQQVSSSTAKTGSYDTEERSKSRSRGMGPGASLLKLAPLGAKLSTGAPTATGTRSASFGRRRNKQAQMAANIIPPASQLPQSSILPTANNKYPAQSAA